MRSLIKKPKPAKGAPAKSLSAAPPEPKVAQCCAKVSKAVAGCHD